MNRLLTLALIAWAGLLLAEARVTSGYVWSMGDERFGGFSGLHVFPGGERFMAMSDGATMFEGRFLRDGEGRISGIDEVSSYPLPDEKGDPIRGIRGDSEGLAVAPDGRVFTSFEGIARLRIEDAGNGLPLRLPRHPDFENMQRNSSLEALAIGPDGALYTIPERSGRTSRPFNVYRLRGETWDIPFTIPRRGPFLVTGADVGPDDMLYVLERDFTGLGFRSRVRRFDLAGGAEEVLFESRTGEHDNLEGISVWREGSGGLVMTMIADDNFRWFQSTEILELRVD